MNFEVLFKIVGNQKPDDGLDDRWIAMAKDNADDTAVLGRLDREILLDHSGGERLLVFQFGFAQYLFGSDDRCHLVRQIEAVQNLLLGVDDAFASRVGQANLRVCRCGIDRPALLPIQHIADKQLGFRLVHRPFHYQKRGCPEHACHREEDNLPLVPEQHIADVAEIQAARLGLDGMIGRHKKLGVLGSFVLFRRTIAQIKTDAGRATCLAYGKALWASNEKPH